MTLAGLLVAATAFTLTPAPPVTDHVPASVEAGLAERWSASFQNVACDAGTIFAPPASEERQLGACGLAPACVSRVARGGRAGVVATLRLSSALRGYRLEAQLVEVESARVRLAFSSEAKEAAGLATALAEVAGRLCRAAVPEAAANARLALDLDLPLAPVAAARPNGSSAGELDLPLPPVEPEPPKAAPPPAVAAGLPTKGSAPPKEASGPPAETIGARAGTPLPPPPLPAFVLLPDSKSVPARSGQGGRLGAYLAAAVAAVAGGSGAYFGLGALDAARTRDGAVGAPAFFAAQTLAARDGTLTNVSWAVAASAAVTGVVLYALNAGPPAP